MLTTTAYARAHSLVDALRTGLSSDALESIKRELRSALEAITTDDNAFGAEAGSHTKLSPRETQVMSMMLAGKRLKEIASDLDISVKTVTTHRARLLRKLNLEDNLGLFRYGVRNGLLSV